MNAQRAGQYALALIPALLAACGGAAQDNGMAEGAAQVSVADSTTGAVAVLPGVDVLLRDSAHVLEGKRIGLITNHTGRTADGRSTIDALHEHAGWTLVALFSPEHGIRGTTDAGARVDSSKDAKTGLPIYSLYGDIREPTPEMLAGLDALVFDIQDIGTRYYTYPWTMALAMRAAARDDKQFVVLDRPDPIGGVRVDGNVLDTAFATFVGLYPVPMRHGMTVGELARMLNTEFHIGADLTVIPAAGWHRSQWYDETGMPWIAPSPNMPSLESATHYPGTCLFEGTNLSVGRGTPRAFAQIGAPWLDADSIAARLNARAMPGVRFEATTFTPDNPGDRKYAGQAVRGIRFIVTDRASYDPTLSGVAALVEIHRLHADSLTFRESHFDRLAGTDRLRNQILAGASVEAITAPWPAQRAAFETLRKPYLLYD